MEFSTDTKFVTVVIGETTEASALRKQLRETDTPSLGTASHLRGVRREIMEREGVVILCVTLDRRTMARYGESLRVLIADAAASCRVRTVGIIPPSEFAAVAATSGAPCDVYVNTMSEVPSAARCLAEHHRDREDFSSWASAADSRPWGGRFNTSGAAGRWGRPGR